MLVNNNIISLYVEKEPRVDSVFAHVEDEQFSLCIIIKFDNHSDSTMNIVFHPNRTQQSEIAEHIGYTLKEGDTHYFDTDVHDEIEQILGRV